MDPAREGRRFLFLEPFFGGSHRDFAEGWAAHSRHRIELLTLPPRFWKWRMRGAALSFYRRVPDPAGYDGLIASSLMGLADLKALWGRACPPALVYFHENQLTYPLAPGESLDAHFGFTNVTSALAADRVLFNSRAHFEAFFARLPEFLRMMPEYRPLWVVERIRRKSAVLHPGCRFPAGDAPSAAPTAGGVAGAGGGPASDPPGGREGGEAGRAGRGRLAGAGEADRHRPPLIVWNHRWEFDKNPGEFFAALDALRERGLEFRLALLGENFQKMPKDFLAARERYGDWILQYGYVPDRARYYGWLRRGSVAVSTALQENFGIAMVEAARHGCLPLLPDRLSYPEILPAAFHRGLLYRGHEELVEKLAELVAAPERFHALREELSRHMRIYAWESLIGRYDEELDALAARRR